MNNKKSSDLNQAKKNAILKELNIVKDLFTETDSAQIPKESKQPSQAPAIQEKPMTRKKEVQIPLLEPSKSSSFDVNFSETAKQKTESAREQANNKSPDTPIIDDITSSLFSDSDEYSSGDSDCDSDCDSNSDDDNDFKTGNKAQQQNFAILEKELKKQAQIIIQELLNKSMSDLEAKINNLLPDLEEHLKKHLDQATTTLIDEALNQKPKA